MNAFNSEFFAPGDTSPLVCFLNHTKDILIISNLKREIQFINKAGLDFFGYTEEEIKGKALKYVIGEMLAPDSVYEKELTSTGLLRDVEMEIFKADMETAFVLLTVMILFDSSGQESGVACLLRDITSDKNFNKQIEDLQEELKKKNQLRINIARVLNLTQKVKGLQALGDSIVSELVQMIGAVYGVVYVNQNFISSRENATLVLAGSYGPLDVQKLIRQIDSGEGFIGQCTVHGKDMYLTEIPDGYVSSKLTASKCDAVQSLAIIPVFFENNVIGVLEVGSAEPFDLEHKEFFDHFSVNLGVLVHGMLSRLQIEKLLNESQTMAEEQAIQSAKLRAMNEQLKNAQMQLIHSERLASIGQLAAGVAHEINNPIGFITGNLAALEEYVSIYLEYERYFQHITQKIQEGQLEAVREILQEVEVFKEDKNIGFIKEDIVKLLKESEQGLDRVRKIVMDLKTFSYSTYDEITDIDIRKLLDEVLTMVNSEIKYRAELIKDYQKVSMIKGNAQGLSQVFLNLVMNAVQALEEKGKIYIRTYQKNEDSVYVEVRDTGRGISKENLKKIFDAFYTTKPVGQGTGLGLSISHEIIKKHQGQISVNSVEGEGTVFTIALPIEHIHKPLAEGTI